MTTAYTSLLGLALPVTGELSGTWGDTVNTAITSLLDSAVAGTTSITTDADVTLTTTTGASNEARQAIILWNPASGTTTRNITAPAQSKLYTVINASGGTQSIVLRGAGPTTGVTIVKGEFAVCAWNGSDFVKVANQNGIGNFTTVDLTNLEVTNIKAKDGTASATIADSTGVMTIASSVLTTTDINGGTIDGTAIGATTANTGAFTTLSSTGTTTLGDATTDAVTVNGYMGVGGAGSTGIGVYVRNTALTATSQVGVQSQITATSAATTGVYGLYVANSTEAASFTVGNAYGVRVSNLSLGAGSSATNQHGLHIADLTSATNNYGITSLVSSGTDKWNIYASGTAANYFAGNVGIGTTPISYVSGIPSIKVGLYGSIGGFQSPSSTSNTVSVNAGVYAVSSAQQNYMVTGQAVTSYSQYLGQHRFYTAPSGTVDTAVTFAERLNIGQSEAVFNDPGNDYDFRVESDTNTHALFVDAGNSRVTVGSGNSQTLFNVVDATAAKITVQNTTNVGTMGLFFYDESNNLQTEFYYDMPTNKQTLAFNGNGLTLYSKQVSATITEIGVAGNYRTLTHYGSAVFNEDGNDYDFRVESDTNTHALFVDAGNSRVGINNSAPGYALDVTVSNATALSLNSGSDNTIALLTSTNASANIDVRSSGARFRIAASGSGAFAVSTGTTSTYTTRLTITDDASPYLRLASGTGGIQFGGDTAAANALDDYEEGTWTPTIVGSSTAGTATHSAQVGRYTKIGRIVTVQFTVTWNSGTGTGDLRVSGLPFTSNNTANNYASGCGQVSNVALTASNYAVFAIVPNVTYVTISQSPVGGGTATNVAYDAAGTIIAMATYEV